ncbi:hypothetical protein, partial [Alistipes putredinis]|uniref:hypothetical protein n=2 Tax=Alistipes putredinis TaxID=28117 RepID=UPI0036F20A05
YFATVPNLSPSVKGVQNTMNKLNVLNVSDANKFAFIKGNRPTDEKAIKVKKDSISEHGILCPITAVNGEEVIKSNGHLTDLDGNDIADEHAKDYYAVLDGQHRLKAYLELGLPLEDLVVIEPLNKKIAIALLIAEMNICTKTWKGSDYMAAPAMAIKETNAAFDFAMELQRRNFPLSTISLWACGNNKLKAKDLVASLKTREMPQCLQEADGWCAKSRKWFEAASEKFTAKFLAKKYLISFIQDGYNVAEDAAAYTLEIEEKLKKLAQWQADKIQNARKTSTQTQEQVILDLLREHL